MVHCVLRDPHLSSAMKLRLLSNKINTKKHCKYHGRQTKLVRYRPRVLSESTVQIRVQPIVLATAEEVMLLSTEDGSYEHVYLHKCRYK